MAKFKARLPWLRLAGIGFIVVMTLGNAAANMLPSHAPTQAERTRAAIADLSATRRARITLLLAQGDRCDPATSRALARELAFDGRSVREYADDVARRCGEDPIVRKWAEAPLPGRGSIHIDEGHGRLPARGLWELAGHRDGGLGSR